MLVGGLLLLLPALGWNWAMPAEMATLVCRQRRKGELWMTTLCLRRLRFRLPSLLPMLPAKSLAVVPSGGGGSVVASFIDCSRAWRRLAMRTPSALHWVQPAYVRGGS